MGYEGEWPPIVSPDHGRRGSVVRLLLVGERIDGATRFALEGTGVMVRRSPSTGRGRLELLLSITTDATPGWRDIELVLGDQTSRLPRAFEILEQVSYGDGWRGIGSHLI